MDTKIKILILSLFTAFNLFGQSPLSLAVRYNITSATGGDPYTVTGVVSDDLSRFTGSDIAIGDSLYVIDGSDLYVLKITAINSVVGPTVNLTADDPSNAGISLPTGQSAIVRPTANYKLPIYISGLRDDLRSMMMNRQAKIIDQITGGGVASITDFISAGQGVPPSALASSNGGETWRNMTTGELWRSDGIRWYSFTYSGKECQDTVTVSLITVQSGGSVTTGSPLVRNSSGVWEHMYNHPSGLNLIPDGVVTDVITGPRAIIQYCGVRKGSGATPNTSYYVDQTVATGFTTTLPTSNIRPLGKVASNGDFLINAGLQFSRATASNYRDSTFSKLNNSYNNKRITDTIQRTAPAIFPVWDKGGVVYNVAAYGIYPGGPNGPDLTLKFRALLDTVAKRHGGIIQFNQGVYRIDGQITIPFVRPLTAQNPGAYDRTPNISIRGVGGYKTAWNTNPDTIKGTVLYLRFNDGLPNRDTIGMIHARGIGHLELSDLNLVADDTTKTAFILINYTTCHIHNVSFWGSGRRFINSQAQDAIVCGGDANPQVTNRYNTHFAGYGSVFENNYFYGIRRAWWARAYTNNVVFQNNTIWYDNHGESCIELATNIPGNVVGGNTIFGNTAEVDGYKYFIKLGKLANANTIIGNGIYDPTIVTQAFIYVDSSAENNQIFAGYWDTDRFFETTGDRQYVKDRNSMFLNNVADTTTLGSSFYIGGNSVFRKSVYVREGLNVNYINPYNIRLRPQSLSNYFDLSVDGSYMYLSSNEFNNILKVHKSALSGALTIDQYGGALFNRTAYNNNAGSYIHPDGRAIFKQSVYIDYNWDGGNDYKLKVNGTSLFNGKQEFSNGSFLSAGTSSPSGSLSAPSGSLYVRRDNGELWGKKYGTGGPTGWGKFLNLVDTLSATSNQVLTWSGSIWAPATNTSESTTIGAFQSSGNSNGLTLSGTDIRLHAATISTPGAVNVGQQTFGVSSGTKLFNGTGSYQIDVDGDTDNTPAGITFTQLGGADQLGFMYMNSADANNASFRLGLEEGGGLTDQLNIGTLNDTRGMYSRNGLYEDVTAVTTSPYTVLYGDRNIYLDGTSITVNLQAIGGSTGETKVGRVIYFFNDNATNVTITPNGSETINDSASLTLLPNTGVTLLAVTGTKWVTRD